MTSRPGTESLSLVTTVTVALAALRPGGGSGNLVLCGPGRWQLAIFRHWHSATENPEATGRQENIVRECPLTSRPRAETCDKFCLNRSIQGTGICCQPVLSGVERTGPPDGGPARVAQTGRLAWGDSYHPSRAAPPERRTRGEGERAAPGPGAGGPSQRISASGPDQSSSPASGTPAPTAAACAGEALCAAGRGTLPGGQSAPCPM